MPASPCTTEEAPVVRAPDAQTASGCPRNFLGNQFVYVVVSPRARGLSIGLNMNPDKLCNFNCVYCEVNRDVPPVTSELDLAVMASELEKTLDMVYSGGIRQLAGFALNPELSRLRHVAFSGDGEPTLCAKFAEAAQAVVHVRARNSHRFFKMVLITNGTGLDLPPVRDGLQYFTRDDEIWIKLDAGSQEYMDRVNQGEVPLTRVLENIAMLGARRPIVIQSLFPLIARREPPSEEIDQYIERLRLLKAGGAMISLVQIYSATRPTLNSNCGHMPLQSLARICRRIKTETGLRAEIF